MHSLLMTTVVLGLAVATALPVRTTTTSARASQEPSQLQAKIWSSGGFALAPENEVNGDEETTVSTNSDRPKIIETTTRSDKAFTKDFTSAVKQEPSVSPLTQLFRQVRSVTSESAVDTTATPFELNFQVLENARLAAIILHNSVNVTLHEMEREAGFSFSTIQTVAILNRPVMETNLREDSANCVNIQDVIIEIIEILDAFKPYVEAIENPYVTVIHLRANLQDLVNAVVIPTSGTPTSTTTTVIHHSQETIYTLIALEYQLQILHEVISNLLKCQ